MDSARIDVRRLGRLFIFTLLMPLVVGIGIDVVFATTPMATLILGVVAIPVATILVLRSTLSEFDRVIDQVAPRLEPAQSEDEDDSSWQGTGLFDDDPQDKGLYLIAEHLPAARPLSPQPEDENHQPQP